MNSTARTAAGALALACAAALALAALRPPETLTPKCPGPNCPLPVQPAPQPKPSPKPKRPWAGRPGGGRCPNPLCLCGPGCSCSPCECGAGDDEPTVDLVSVPGRHRPRNCGGRDGSGLCVFTSIQYASWWQNEPRLKDFQAKMRAEPGGGYPQKVDAMIAKYGAGTRYVQYEGRDPAIIELALKTGRLPSITWGGNHMLNCVHLDASRAAIVDNNDPNNYHWYSRSQFLSRWQQGGGGWVVVLLNPGPPPAPAPRLPRPRMACPEDARDTIESDEEWPAGGVAWTPRAGERYTLCGRASSWREVGDQLVDDSLRLHLTVIGPDAERQRALADLAGVRDRYVVQDYAPDAWECAAGFVTGGRPTVYLQARDGRVLLRRDAYRDGADLVGALRRADPGYDPSQDPTGTPAVPGGALIDWAQKQPGSTWLLAAGAVLGGWYWWSNRQLQPAQPAAAQRATGPAPAAPAQQPTRPITLDDMAMELGRRQLQQALQGLMPAAVKTDAGGAK